MTVDPIEVVGEWLQDLLDPGVVNRLVASEATYVSLNTEDAELSKIMPWAGTSRGPQAFLDNLGNMFARWENQAFNVNEIFASGENVRRLRQLPLQVQITRQSGQLPVLDSRQGC